MRPTWKILEEKPPKKYSEFPVVLRTDSHLSMPRCGDKRYRQSFVDRNGELFNALGVMTACVVDTTIYFLLPQFKSYYKLEIPTIAEIKRRDRGGIAGTSYITFEIKISAVENHLVMLIVYDDFLIELLSKFNHYPAVKDFILGEML